MKKSLAILLLIAMVISLVGCGKTGTDTPSGGVFRAGYGRAYITPEENLPLGGYGNSKNRIMKDVLDDTFVTCIAMTDAQDNTVLLMCVDLQRIADDLIAVLRQSVTQAVGVQEDNIIITSSHTHSIPDLTLTDHEGIQRYKQLLVQRFADAAAEAMADRAPATMYVGSVDAEGMNFVKHYQVVDENGELQHFGDNFGTQIMNETTKHVSEAYNKLSLIQFKREGKKDIIINNFRAHPTLTGGQDQYNLSSDFIGPWRDAVEDALDCHFAFVQGACGNINPRSRLVQENYGTEKDHHEHGYRMAQFTLEGIEKHMTQVETGLVQCKRILFSAKVDHSFDRLLTYAKAVSQYYSSGATKTAADLYARQFGISSIYHASSIQVTSKMGETQDIELMVFSIGDQVGFFSAPGELFDVMSVEMEQESPFPTTITVGFSNGDWKYFPYGVCAEYNSYESDYGRFEKGVTAAEMKTVWLEQLNEFYNTAKGN